MSKTILKDKGKCLPIRITKETRASLKRYKKRLQEMRDQDEVSETDKRIIDIVFKELTDYECNILCAYYDLAEESPTKLGRILGISSGVASSRVKKINNKIRKKILDI